MNQFTYSGGLRGPAISLPPPLRGVDPDSFARYTIHTRLPSIVRRVIDENTLPERARRRLEALIDQIPGGNIRPLVDVQAPDTAEWARYVEPFLGQDWDEVPWFFAETYFFRRILEAIDYFLPGGNRPDPYGRQKRLGLNTAWTAIHLVAAQLERALAQSDVNVQDFAFFMRAALWGNQADMSLWPAGTGEGPQHVDETSRSAHMLIDNTMVVSRWLQARRRQQLQTTVAIVADNAGHELAADLLMADYWLGQGIADSIVLHLKAHPTFVSDATIPDVEATLQALAEASDSDARAAGRRLLGYRTDGRLQLEDHLFWTSPLAFWQMPDDLHQNLSQMHLLISKGDANYRRLLGDRHWPFTTPLADIVSYLPTALLALRTLKAEVGAGFQPAQIVQLDETDPDWRTNGAWGVIQFVRRVSS